MKFLRLAIVLGLSWAFPSQAATNITQRQIVLEAIDQRPTELWPRSLGHVILGWPGSREADKGYHEPGGSFSPGAGSFGMSLWVVDDENQVQSSSDTLPLDKIRQRFEWLQDKDLPAIVTETALYDARWSMVRPGLWQLRLKTHPGESAKVCLVIRSVGPAGGPVRSLEWRDQQLIVNRRWIVSTDPALTELYGGREGNSNWITTRHSLTNWSGTNGWGYAVFSLPGQREWTVHALDSTSPTLSPLRYGSTKSSVEISLPDPTFVQCLNAQVAHLLMGLVGWETRPADPLSFPMSWTSDGAFVVSSLARAGQLEVARQLCRSLCEPDFAGGFGPEADAPGLALWALNEVAASLQDPLFKQGVWPHVVRKSEIIQKMITTSRPLQAPVRSPVALQYQKHPELTLVCEPARNGWIVGRVDWQRPLLYVNAVSYRGLLSAVEMADWVGNAVADARWRALAAEIKNTWNTTMHTSDANDEHTAICGLWPTWVATDKSGYAYLLNQRWTQNHDAEGKRTKPPQRMAFALAEAHQWLYLGQPEYVWNTWEWFLAHQSSPGLYTWGDQAGAENTFRRWDTIRGWVNPPHVTPHYRTAAEMLLLQLDMLAFVDDSGAEPVLVVGAGIPAHWLQDLLGVRGLPTRLGPVDWTWDKRVMTIRVHGRVCPVRLGPAFPAQAFRTQFTHP
jgi:hypothetical protein